MGPVAQRSDTLPARSDAATDATVVATDATDATVVPAPATPGVPPTGRRPERTTRDWWLAKGHLFLAVAGSLLFVVVKPPVADLQAADARAGAAARHVGLGYWLSWFGGSSPGQYSILTPAVASVVGVTTLAAASVIAIGFLARPLLANTYRHRSAAYLVVISALCNLWSGRVPFSVGIAISLAGLLLLLRGRPLLGGVVNALATLFSPLAPVFILLVLIGPALARPDWRGRLIRFGIPSVLGIAVPALLFGAPSPMPFAWTTLAWCIGIMLAALLLDLPRPMRIGLWASALACLALFVIPSGVGANISRYAFLLLPPVIWAVARNSRRVVVLALLPAFAYSGYLVVRDLNNAAQPAAQQTYYQGLRAELGTLGARDNHRAEILDTPTHRASAELVPDVYLARGWETQSDSTSNAIFYRPDALTATSYQQWLSVNAVAWVAVPNAPGPTYQAEASLVGLGLNYLHEIWHDGQWTLFAVQDAKPIVPVEANLVSSDETRFVFDVTRPSTMTFRVRPIKGLRIASIDGAGPAVCLLATPNGELQATFAAAGRYQLTAGVAVTSSVKSEGC
ncbi:hypothetical protein M6D93_14585 [Jatrophihabitans telluris]|uniref:MFS transporter n=1 Tax=Jatrophihabitans telluris TaxID=2038343 RepID=A0ABY4QX51_9ACTN|nr:hypothetical protein [Jatrophihabitans telluris]UQX87519.1 hypothetical protein M6D93_14585 [Jatrophihabitans telluris]